MGPVFLDFDFFFFIYFHLLLPSFVGTCRYIRKSKFSVGLPAKNWELE